MTVIRRRLFWRIYLTLLCSLVVVAILMGGLWWLLGETPRDHWGAFHLALTDELMAPQTSGDVVQGAVRRLGETAGADVSLYGPDGVLIAARGAPAGPPDDQARWGRPLLRLDLPGGRTALVHFTPPAGRRAMAILFAMLIVAGGVGLAAFPMTARLTRRLEGLRAGMARWGGGDVAARVDGRGSDEVASVARTFNAAAERIAVLLASQRALLANASHELRSPLARLRLAVDLWQTRPDGPGRDEIVRNLFELDELVDEILLSSRLEHPSSTLGHVDLVDLLGLAAEEAARVGARLDGEPVEVAGNEMLLRRLIRNLLENGVKHGRPPVRVTVLAHGREARVSVADDGCGIPPDERDRVFEPFYRPAGRGESGGGWGLGLSLVRQIAARHGGRVTCEEGEAGRGSRFVVCLPFEARQDGGPASRAGSPPVPQAGPVRSRTSA